jgi:hypothetical protein
MNRSSRLDVSSIRVLRPARLDPYYAVEDAWVDVRFVPEADLIARDRVGPLPGADPRLAWPRAAEKLYLLSRMAGVRCVADAINEGERDCSNESKQSTLGKRRGMSRSMLK